MSSDSASANVVLDAALARGLADAEAGRVRDLADAIAKLLREFGLQVEAPKA